MGEAYYESVTRYTASTFLRLKLGDALKDERSVARIYETMEKARRILKKSDTSRKRVSNIQNGRASRGRKAS